MKRIIKKGSVTTAFHIIRGSMKTDTCPSQRGPKLAGKGVRAVNIVVTADGDRWVSGTTL